MKTSIGSGCHTQILDVLTRIATQCNELAKAGAIAVRRARTDGFSWAEIGTVPGVSKQAMHCKNGQAA